MKNWKKSKLEKYIFRVYGWTLITKEPPKTEVSATTVTTTLPGDLNNNGKVSVIEKNKLKNEEKKAEGKLTFFEKIKAKIEAKTTPVKDVTTTDTTTNTDETTGGKTENKIDEFANSETPTNDETSLKNSLGKLIKEHPVVFAIVTTIVASGIAFAFPQVREWAGISSNTKTKKLGVVSLS